MEGWVDLGTAVSMQPMPKLCISVIFVKRRNFGPQRDSNLNLSRHTAGKYTTTRPLRPASKQNSHKIHFAGYQRNKISTEHNVRLHQRDKRRDTWNRIWCKFSLKMWHLVAIFNDFPDNQLTKFHVFIAWSPLNFYEVSRFVHHRMDAPDRHNGQADVSPCSFVP